MEGEGYAAGYEGFWLALLDSVCDMVEELSEKDEEWGSSRSSSVVRRSRNAACLLLFWELFWPAKEVDLASI